MPARRFTAICDICFLDSLEASTAPGMPGLRDMAGAHDANTRLNAVAIFLADDDQGILTTTLRIVSDSYKGFLLSGMCWCKGRWEQSGIPEIISSACSFPRGR